MVVGDFNNTCSISSGCIIAAFRPGLEMVDAVYLLSTMYYLLSNESLLDDDEMWANVYTDPRHMGRGHQATRHCDNYLEIL